MVIRNHSKSIYWNVQYHSIGKILKSLHNFSLYNDVQYQFHMPSIKIIRLITPISFTVPVKQTPVKILLKIGFNKVSDKATSHCVRVQKPACVILPSINPGAVSPTRMGFIQFSKEIFSRLAFDFWNFVFNFHRLTQILIQNPAQLPPQQTRPLIAQQRQARPRPMQLIQINLLRYQGLVKI